MEPATATVANVIVLGLSTERFSTGIVLTEVACGTDLAIVQEGIPDAIPVEMCYLGWQESLQLLGQLVQAEIPD